MQLDISIYLGWTGLGRCEIPDEELAALWQQHQADYAASVYGQEFQGHPDYTGFLHNLVYERFEAPVLERLRAVEGIISLDWADDEIHDMEGNTI